MAAEKIDVLLIGPEKPVIAKGLYSTFNVLKLHEPLSPPRNYFKLRSRL
jgi:hypothetical protein